jgi:hypothetical protein
MPGGGEHGCQFFVGGSVFGAATGVVVVRNESNPFVLRKILAEPFRPGGLASGTGAT